MKCQRKIGSFNVVASCGDDLKEQAEALLDVLAEIDREKSPLKDGTTIEFGWSILTLCNDDEDELTVCEPYFGGDPFHNNFPMVDNTLSVLTEQITLLNRLNIEGVNASFQDRILIDKGCLQAQYIYLERKSPEANTNDSGWYMGELTKEMSKKPVDSFEVIYVYQLLKQRPQIMKILVLPPGYLVMFDGTRIEAIFNEKDQNILK
jgi:hypothetical protein